MGKLIKYELKGSYKYILGVLALVIILTGAIYFYMSNFTLDNQGGILGAAFIGLSFMVIFATMFATFFYIVNLYSKELYEDRGYLTFTLPLTGRQILGSKLVVAVIWFGLLGVGVLLANLIGIRQIMPKELWNQIPFGEILGSVRASSIISGLVYSLLGGLVTLITVYFSMTLGRFIVKGKRLKGLWFILFLIISFIIGLGSMKVRTILPYYLNVNHPAIESYDSIKKDNSLTFGTDEDGIEMELAIGQLGLGNSEIMFNNQGDTLYNIGDILYNILILVLGYFGTSYLLEKKLDF